MPKRPDEYEVYSMLRRPGESVKQLHVRKANAMRRAQMYFYDHNWDCDSCQNCIICWFGVKIAINIHITTRTGRISGMICEKCAIKIGETLCVLIDKQYFRRKKERQDAMDQSERSGRARQTRKAKKSKVRVLSKDGGDPRVRLRAQSKSSRRTNPLQREDVLGLLAPGR